MRKTKGYLKKAAVAMLILVLGLFMLTSCSSKQDEVVNLKIVCTTFPQYDWVREIVKDVEGVEVTFLEDKGVDLHSYQATADDIIKIKESNLVVYVGGESDDWMDDVMEDTTNPHLNLLKLMAVLGEKVKMEEIKEGMQIEPHEHDTEPDEHIWLSLQNAKILTVAIADKLAAIDTENAEKYQQNASAYIGKLDKLDSEYKDTVLRAEKKTLLFGDRFPFRYLLDDYGIDYYAAFVGCSAETEASFETVAFLAKKVDELGLNSVVTIDRSNKQIAKTIVENSKKKSAKIVTLNSMQTVDKKQVDAGATYIGIMQENLDVLKEALK